VADPDRDFADAYPDTEVIGTDLSPTQPSWVPPNVQFEIDDATQPWTWPEHTFSFVHMRYLFGAIVDWPELFRQAFRATAPGGYVQSCECDIELRSDDGSVEGVHAMTTWSRLFLEGGKKMGRSFTVIAEDLQRKSMLDAGFIDVEFKDFKVSDPGGPAGAERRAAADKGADAGCAGMHRCPSARGLPNRS